MIKGKLSLVLPAHNEAENLPAVVNRALAVLPELVEDFEIIVVNDGSTDGTGQVAHELHQADARVRVVEHPRNRGYGAALTSGFQAASGDYIMFMDSDQQFDVADLSFLSPFVGEYDVVAGYRVDRKDARYRIIYAEIFKLAMRFLFGIRLRDIDCAFKVVRADLVRSAQLESPGALINTELLAKLRREGASWVEIGVNHYPRAAGESSGGSPRVVIRAMKETILLWFRMRRYTPHLNVRQGQPQQSKGRWTMSFTLACVVLALGVWLAGSIARRRRP